MSDRRWACADPDDVPACPNCGVKPEWGTSTDVFGKVVLDHSVPTCTFKSRIHHYTREHAAGAWMTHLMESFPRHFPRSKGREVRPQPIDFEFLQDLEAEARRDWLVCWMSRMGFANANQAAPFLALSRQSVERMVYSGSTKQAVTDQTLRIAQLTEILGPSRLGIAKKATRG